MLGTWHQPRASESAKWRYEGQGVFEELPQCVADPTVDRFEKKTKIQFPPSTRIYEVMLTHISLHCPSMGAQNANRRAHNTFSPTQAGGSEQGGKADMIKFGWLCLLFGEAEPLILIPQHSSTEHKLVYVTANRSPYQHFWAAQLLHAVSFRHHKSHDHNSLWCIENRWTMNATFTLPASSWPEHRDKDKLEIIHGSRQRSPAHRWHDRIAGISYDDQSSNHAREGSNTARTQQQLSLAFPEGSSDDEIQLRQLEKEFKKMAKLEGVTCIGYQLRSRLWGFCRSTVWSKIAVILDRVMVTTMSS